MKGSWVSVDGAVLAANIAALRAALQPRTEIMFVIKADAYGHGLLPTAQLAVAAGVRWFGVAHLREALQVRAVLPSVNLLVMGVVEPADAAVVARENLACMVVDVAHGRALAAAARAAGVTVRAHLKVDTGMGRLGVQWPAAVASFAALQGMPELVWEGICSHFATVEPEQPSSAATQAERFLTIAAAAEERLGRPLRKHISSSRAIVYHPEWDLEMVRPGIALYGYGAAEAGLRFQTAPALQWQCQVMQVKSVPAGTAVGYYGTHVTPAPTRLAILSAGYADGYHRALSNRGHVLIRGRRCRVVGRVSMNWISVDVGPEGPAEPGDTAVLIGQQGSVSVWAGELARLCRTIPYEMLVGIDRQAERHYINDAATSPRSC